jgi:putative FmdB family regulatory protein
VPIYDYACSNCGQMTEVIHGIDAAGPRFCPACGAEGTLRKAFAAPAVHFKGSGWAKKDRSSSSAGGSRAKPAADAGVGDGKEGGKATEAASAGTSGGEKSSAGNGSAGADAAKGSPTTRTSRSSED